MKRFAELEDKELRLSDDLHDTLIDLQMAKLTVKKFEKSVAEIRKKIQENDDAMRNFKWWKASD